MLSTTGVPQQASAGSEGGGGAYSKALIPAAQSPALPFGALAVTANPAAALVNELLGGLGAGGALGFPALPLLPPLQLQVSGARALRPPHATLPPPPLHPSPQPLLLSPPRSPPSPSLQNLSYNAIETKDALHVTIDAPGVTKEGFSVQVLPPSVEGGRSSLLVRVSRGGVSHSGDFNTFREERCVGRAAARASCQRPLRAGHPLSLPFSLAPLCPPPQPRPPSPPLLPLPSPPPRRSWSGQASRSIPLPAWVDPDQVRVEGLCSGVLSLTCPRHVSAAAFPAPRYLSIA